jgi:hypothetical protein
MQHDTVDFYLFILFFPLKRFIIIDNALMYQQQFTLLWHILCSAAFFISIIIYINKYYTTTWYTWYTMIYAKHVTRT